MSLFTKAVSVKALIKSQVPFPSKKTVSHDTFPILISTMPFRPTKKIKSKKLCIKNIYKKYLTSYRLQQPVHRRVL